MRRANGDIQDCIQPSQLKWPKRVLEPRDLQEIKRLEKEDCVGAVEKLVEKLLESKNPDWPELFVASLEPNFPKVATAMKYLAEKLKNNIFIDAKLEIVEPSKYW